MKNIFIKLGVLSSFAISLFLVGCTPNPTETDVLQLINNKYGGNSYLLINVNLQKKDGARDINDKKVFAYTASIDYIRAFACYGYVSGCPERHCWKDEEFIKEIEYLIAKNEWDEWYIYDSRTIKHVKIATYWRPESKSIKEFYKDRIINNNNKKTTHNK